MEATPPAFVISLLSISELRKAEVSVTPVPPKLVGIVGIKVVGIVELNVGVPLEKLGTPVTPETSEPKPPLSLGKVDLKFAVPLLKSSTPVLLDKSSPSPP